MRITLRRQRQRDQLADSERKAFLQEISETQNQLTALLARFGIETDASS